MTESLRERQKRMAREAILEAVADQVAEAGSLDFSVADVARRAGVSHRTVYNYFGSRQELIDAVSEWANERMRSLGGTITPDRLGDIPPAVKVNFALFEEMGGLAEAFARMDTAGETTAARNARTAAFTAVVAPACPDLDERQRLAVAAVLRQLASVRSWYLLTREHGLSVEEAAAVTSWALDRLTSALEAGELPA